MDRGKSFELPELASKAFKRVLTTSNIKARFRRIGIWPINYDALLHDMACSQAFDIHGQEDADSMLSLYQGHYLPWVMMMNMSVLLNMMMKQLKRTWKLLDHMKHV